VDAGGGRRWRPLNISSLARARTRLGADPLHMLFEEVAGPVGAADAAGVFCCGLRVVLVDGSTLDVPTTPENDEHFGRGSNATRAGAFPQVRWLAAAESGTGALVGATLGPYTVGEQTLALDLLSVFGEGMLVLADRSLCATRRFIIFPAQVGGIGGTFLGPMAYPDSKEGWGLEHANKTGGRVQTDGAVRRGDPRDMAKLRREALCRIPDQIGGNSEERSWIELLTSARKGGREQSMRGNR
jgi:hypothetical protein